MRQGVLMIGLCFLLTGCATRGARDAAAEARGYARGLQQAVKEEYWRIQDRQRDRDRTTTPILP